MVNKGRGECRRGTEGGREAAGRPEGRSEGHGQTDGGAEGGSDAGRDAAQRGDDVREGGQACEAQGPGAAVGGHAAATTSVLRPAVTAPPLPDARQPISRSAAGHWPFPMPHNSDSTNTGKNKRREQTGDATRRRTSDMANNFRLRARR